MSKIKVEGRENVGVLRFDNGVTNPVSSEFVDDMSISLKRVKNEFRGIVITGGSKFFSIGLDVPELIKLDRSAMTDFWYRFNQVTFDLYTLPLPTACALAGHAPAAGTILALACDFRFAAAGNKKIGLNEVRLGLPVPYLAGLMLRQIVCNRAATEMLYRGELIEPAKALEIGLIDEIVDRDKVEERAVERTAELAAIPQTALAAVKANRVEDVRLKFGKNLKEQHEIFLDCWFSKPSQELLAKAAEKF
jgi:enoyl-CoA hydratase/carnithine racemase